MDSMKQNKIFPFPSLMPSPVVGVSTNNCTWTDLLAIFSPNDAYIAALPPKLCFSQQSSLPTKKSDCLPHIAFAAAVAITAATLRYTLAHSYDLFLLQPSALPFLSHYILILPTLFLQIILVPQNKPIAYLDNFFHWHCLKAVG